MGYKAKVIADSINGTRITTLEISFPRIVLAEFNTHRVFSRNSASSRAIPIEKMLERVMNDPFIPDRWPINRPGMQATEYLAEGSAVVEARIDWLHARNEAVNSVYRLQRHGVHKQITNRLLEPWLWHTVVVTSTEWENFFNQRRDKDAQPEIQKIANLMFAAYEASTPTQLADGAWHLPYVTAEDFEAQAAHALTPDWDILARLACARCARVSYARQGEARDFAEDLATTARLLANGHTSPLEHAATPRTTPGPGALIDAATQSVWFGNFRGWQSYRKTLPDEAVFRKGLGPRMSA